MVINGFADSFKCPEPGVDDVHPFGPKLEGRVGGARLTGHCLDAEQVVVMLRQCGSAPSTLECCLAKYEAGRHAMRPCTLKGGQCDGHEELTAVIVGPFVECDGVQVSRSYSPNFGVPCLLYDAK